MTTLRFHAANLLLIVFITGCTTLAPLLSTPTPAPITPASATPQPMPTSTVSAEEHQPVLLRVWVPPQFDPNADNPAAELLRSRLAQFQDEHPAIEVEVRIKSQEDILKVLSVTMNAASEATPDLIALTYFDMQEAASAGFLHPLEGLTSILQDPDWYVFARELGEYQNTEYGIPFAGDVLVMVYRAGAFPEKSESWETLFASGARLIFPALEPGALFALSQYLSIDKQPPGDPSAMTLEEETLAHLLRFYERGIETNTLLRVSHETQTDAQALQVLRAGGAEIAVVRVSSHIQNPSGEYQPLMGLDDVPYTVGDGWVWALAGSNTEKQIIAVELASYLVESAFLAPWTEQAGILPVRPQALSGWENVTVKTPLNEVLQSAHPIPPEPVAELLGPLLQGALIRVMNGEPAEIVARNVIEGLK
jgi:ABC-type glycerol-3-phosphate transport system substrate-binding protein